MSMRQISADEMQRLLIALAVYLVNEDGGTITVPAADLSIEGDIAVVGDDYGDLTFTLRAAR